MLKSIKMMNQYLLMIIIAFNPIYLLGNDTNLNTQTNRNNSGLSVSLTSNADQYYYNGDYKKAVKEHLEELTHK